MLRRLQTSKTFVCVYTFLHLCANSQTFQTLVPAKNSHLKVDCLTWGTLQPSNNKIYKQNVVHCSTHRTTKDKMIVKLEGQYMVETPYI